MIATYSLIALSDIQVLLAILLITIAILTDRQLGHRSNIMIPFLFLPDAVRTLVSNIDVVESIDPALLNLSDAVCLVIQHAQPCCYAATMWLLVAISVHRYFLCVKMRSEINRTVISLTISLVTLVISISGVAALVVYAKWDVLSDDTAQGNATQQSQTGTFTNRHNSVMGSDLSKISETENRKIACMNREDIMGNSNTLKVILALVISVVPTIIQMCFYRRIYLHLKQQQERFASNQQVATRLHANSQATIRTAFASFSIHFLVVVLFTLVARFISSMEVRLVLAMVLSNVELTGMISSLFLHGGYRLAL